MKIACPVCNQHFEVEANMLDRYFRCTECKTLFLGLNANVVKEPKFVRKSELESSEEEVYENESVELADATTEKIEKSVEADEEVAVEEPKTATRTTPIEVFGEIFELDSGNKDTEFSEKQSLWKKRDFLTMAAAYTGCFAAAAALVVAVIALLVGRNSTVQADIAAREQNISARIENIVVQVNAAAANVESIKVKVEDLQRFRDHLSNKIGTVNVETQLASIDVKLKSLEAVTTELESVKNEHDEMKKQLPAVRQGKARRR